MIKQRLPFRITPLRVVAVLLLVGVAVWTVKSGQLITPAGGDSETQHLPSRALAAEMYRAACLPLWNQYESSGLPLAALAQPGAFYPLNLLLYGPFPPAVAFNVSLVLHFLLLAFFTRRYLQSLRLSATAITLGTVSFTFCGFALIHTGAVPIFNAVVWIPGAFYGAEKWIQTGRWRYPAYAGVCVALCLLAGWAQLLLLSSLYLALYGLLALPAVSNRKRFLLGFAVLFAIAACVSMPQAVLTIGFKPYTSLQSLEPYLLASSSYPPQLLMLLLFPSFFGSLKGSFYKPGFWWGPPDGAIMTIYVGILPLMLAAAALPQWRTSRVVRFFAMLLMLAPLMAFGVYTPLGSLLYQLPLFKFFHDHWINFVFFSFAVATLAAHAADKLDFPELSVRARQVWSAAIPLLLAGITALTLIKSRWLVESINPKLSPLADHWMVYFHQTVKFNNPGVMIPILLILFCAGFFWSWTRRPHSPAMARLVVLLVLADLVFFGLSYIVWIAPGSPTPDSRQILNLMQQDTAGAPFRALALQTTDPFLKVNTNSLQHYGSIIGYEPFLPYPYADLFEMNTGGTTDLWPQLIVNNRIISMLNVRYIIAEGHFTKLIGDLVDSGELGQEQENTANAGNLLPPSQWKAFGQVESMGEVNRFQSNGKNLVGISQENIGLDKNTIYALSFDVRADKGERDAVVGIIVFGNEVDYCHMRRFMLGNQYQRNTCLYLTYDASQKVDVKFLTLSPAAAYVRDIRLVKVGRLPESTNGYQVRAQAGNLTLLENKNVLPRAFLVDSLHSVASYSDARSELWQVNTALDLRKTALVEDIPSAAPASVDPGKVEDIRYGPNRVDLRVSCQGKCFLVLADQFSPGWHALVDGEETKIYRTDAVIRGLFVPAGTHEIHYVYRPSGLGWGLAAGVIGILFAGGLVRLDWKRPKAVSVR